MQIKKYRSGLLIIVYIAFGVYCFVLGDNGILEKIKLEQGKREIAENISKLEIENQVLQKEYEIISNDTKNKEVYKELASGSGFIGSDEKYVFFKGENGDLKEKEKSNKPKDLYPVKLSHLRILWGISSIMIILIYLARRRRLKEREEPF